MKVRAMTFATLLAIFGCSDTAEPPQPGAVLSAYPNPMKNVLFVTVDNMGAPPAKLLVFDPNGELVADDSPGAGVNLFQYNVSDRPTGRFHIICKVEGEVYTTEILKK